MPLKPLAQLVGGSRLSARQGMRGASSPDKPYLRIDLARSNGYQANISSSYPDPVSTGDKLTFAMMLGHNATLGLARGECTYRGSVRFEEWIKE